MLRAIELFDRPHTEVFIELIGVLQVNDVDSENVLSVRCAIEPNAVVLGA